MLVGVISSMFSGSGFSALCPITINLIALHSNKHDEVKSVRKREF